MSEKICAFLIHLSENFWGDTPVSKHPGFEGWPTGPAFRDHILCEDKAWDLVVSELPRMGINTLVIDLGVVAVILGFVTYQMKSPKALLIVNLITCGVFCLHYLLIGAISGAVMNGLGILRNVVYFP